MTGTSYAIVLSTILLCGCAPRATPSHTAQSNAAHQPGKYERMRFEFAAAEDYNAYSIQMIEKALIEEAMAAWKKGDAVTTAKRLQEVLEVCPVSIEAHRRLADMYQFLVGETEDADKRAKLGEMETYHRQMADGLVKSITDSGDGKSRETAYKVISISEEYMTLFYLGLEGQEQVVESGDKGAFDVLTAVDDKGTQHRVYFDISTFYR